MQDNYVVESVGWRGTARALAAWLAACAIAAAFGASFVCLETRPLPARMDLSEFWGPWGADASTGMEAKV